MTGDAAWAVVLTDAAEADFEEIVAWTEEQFGPAQARLYADTLHAALVAFGDGPEFVGVKRRNEIGKDIGTLHIARAGRRGRHFILFRARADKQPPAIEVLRILHDAMDLARHVPGSESEPG